jgi:hypothetical protein
VGAEARSEAIFCVTFCYERICQDRLRTNTTRINQKNTAVRLSAGESSGAGSVSSHLVAPRSFGLFKTAAMSSGAFGTWVTASLPLAQATYDGLLNDTKCHRVAAAAAAAAAAGGGGGSGGVRDQEDEEEGIACLRRVPLPALIKMPSVVTSGAFGPVIDGVELRCVICNCFVRWNPMSCQDRPRTNGSKAERTARGGAQRHSAQSRPAGTL